tara:strand:+ start:484 stop:798 length:315 start_codon:yes stop_codon:yes gene_type:complete
MSEINPTTAFQGGQGAFTDSSDANQSLINDISNVMNSTPPSLPSHLQQSAKQAGELASNARTLEDKQNIYKNYLSKANGGNQETSAKMVADWEKTAEFYRKNKS